MVSVPLGTTPVGPVKDLRPAPQSSRPPAEEAPGPAQGASQRRYLPHALAVTLALAGLAAAFVASSLDSSTTPAASATPQPVKILPGASAARVADDRAQSGRHDRSRAPRG